MMALLKALPKCERRAEWKKLRGERVTIVHHESGHTWELSKALLMQHSGFFKVMFSHNFLETEKSIVTLHEDRLEALDYLIRWIKEPGKIDEMNIEHEFRQVHNILDNSSHRYDSPEEELSMLRRLHEEMLEFWIVADKYDASSYICRNFAEQFERLCAWSHNRSSPTLGSWYGRRSIFSDPEDFHKQHCTALTERLGGTYPPELYGIYTYHVQFFETQAFGLRSSPTDDSAEERHRLSYGLIEAAYADQVLSIHISKCLLRKIRKFEDDQAEDSRTDRWFDHFEPTIEDLSFSPKKEYHNSGRQIWYHNFGR